MNVNAAIHRSNHLMSRPRRRDRIGPPRAATAMLALSPSKPGKAADVLDMPLLQQLQAAGIAIDSLVAIPTATGEWLLLTCDRTGRTPASPIASEGDDDEAFASAVRVALDDFHLTHRLRSNPLLNCAAIEACGTTAAARLNTLRDWLRGTNEKLSANPATARAARILHRTYFEPARSQQLAAEALGLGYSTYRRLLAEARELLIAELRLA